MTSLIICRTLSWEDFCAADGGGLSAGAEGDGVVVWECESSDADAVGSAYSATHAALPALQCWLSADRAGKFVVLTRGAVGLAGEDVSDLAAAAVWGLVRSAQSEHPGRIVLIDTDTAVDAAVLAAAGETQLLVRGGAVHAAGWPLRRRYWRYRRGGRPGGWRPVVAERWTIW